MSLSALLSLGAGLAFVLGLMALLLRLAKSVRPDLMGGRDEGGVEVLTRRPLAHRQGVAVVRFQGRLLLLSYGEGGVNLLSQEVEPLSEEGFVDQAEPRAESRMDRVSGSSGRWEDAGATFPRVWNRVRKAAGLGTMALCLLTTSGFHLQAAGQEPVPPQSASPEAPTANALSPEGAVFGLMRQLPDMDLQVGDGEDGLQLNGPVGTVLFIGFLTLLPTLLLMMTGFTRILVVLHLLKQALGTQTAPPTHLLTAMALLLTGFVMAPTLTEVNRTALTPWLEGEMDELQMIQTASVPFRGFMLGSTREEDLATFLDMHGSERPETVDDIPMVVVTSAFVTSELRHAFQMGFALFLPFVVIDIVVASVLMSMGMFMLPPVMVSLPFKLLLFVLVDGWSLIVGGLVRSFV